MAINIYDYQSMTRVVNLVKTPEPFLLEMFFSGKVDSNDTETIQHEIISGGTGIATFVGPNADPVPVKQATRKVEIFTLPRTYESKNFNANAIAKFRNSAATGFIGTKAEIAKNANQKIMYEVSDLKNRVIMLREVMASQLLRTGVVTVVHDGQTYTYSFGFTSDNRKTLGANYKWDAGSTRNISGDFDAAIDYIVENTGYNSIDVIMGKSAWASFVKDETVMKQLNNLNYQVGKLILNQPRPSRVQQYKGNYKGVNIYTYTQTYKDKTNATQHVWPANEVSFIANNENIRIQTGPIYKFGENKETLAVVNEMLLWPTLSDRRDNLEWALEQKSLPTIKEPGAVYSLVVQGA